MMENQNNAKDDMQTIEDMISASGRTVHKYYANGKEKSSWCIMIESDDAQSQVVLSFDDY